MRIHFLRGIWENQSVYFMKGTKPCYIKKCNYKDNGYSDGEVISLFFFSACLFRRFGHFNILSGITPLTSFGAFFVYSSVRWDCLSDVS
jgi:hypothetical protein